jgi:hypothetical protein
MMEFLGMSRLIKWVLVLAAIAGGLVFLAGQATEKPVARQEKMVSPDALGK